MKIEKTEKLLANLHDNTEYVIQIRNLKQILNRGLVFKRIHKGIKIYENAWIILVQGKKGKNGFEDFFKLMDNAFFGKDIENVRKHRDIKLATTERRRNYFVSEPNYHTTTFFIENLLVIEMEKTEIPINKAVYLGPSVTELSKILIYEFCYNYVKPRYDENAKLCYMDRGSFIVHVKTDDIYKYIAEGVETRFGT